ncbi:hypothetical protein [Carboxylicivirga sp. N1Y90]|uniref:hypothetical protein n=1 Tax=Carboxylicivirga fragile TaxID=3417571 RepID=UPI003D345677|nr:hypothetical protein [Marinilabiliaceae bacterium N1Y90]
MLTNNFFSYTIQNQSESEIEALLKLNEKSDIYKGHFPEMPITPGVCQVQMVSEIIKECIDTEYTLKSARDIKFLKLINPQEILSLHLKITLKQNDENELSINALFSQDGNKYLKMRALYSRK